MNAGDYEIKDDLFYTKEHEWLNVIDSSKIVIGITDYAAKTLKDVVYVDLPKVDEEVKQSAAIGSVESIKAVSEIYSPLSGKIIEVNDKLSKAPELINQSPYEDGWIVKILPSNFNSESKSLLSTTGYSSFIEGLLSKNE